MIAAHIEKDPHHQFRFDDRNGLFMLFVSKDMLGTGQIFKPHWAREFGNKKSRQAMCRWTAHRRDE